MDQVYLTAQKFGVRARIRREVDDAYARLKQFENEFLTLQAKVNQALNRAEKLKAQAQKETALGKNWWNRNIPTTIITHAPGNC